MTQTIEFGYVWEGTILEANGVTTPTGGARKVQIFFRNHFFFFDKF